MIKPSNFPAGQENIDDIRDIEEAKELQDSEVMDLDPLSLDELGELYEQLNYKRDDLDAAIVEIKKTIFDKMETDSQKVGPYNAFVSRAAKFPKLTVDKARELGLTKIEEKIDTALCKKAHQNGVDLGPVEYSEAMVMRKIVEGNKDETVL